MSFSLYRRRALNNSAPAQSHRLSNGNAFSPAFSADDRIMKDDWDLPLEVCPCTVNTLDLQPSNKKCWAPGNWPNKFGRVEAPSSTSDDRSEEDLSVALLHICNTS